MITMKEENPLELEQALSERDGARAQAEIYRLKILELHAQLDHRDAVIEDLEKECAILETAAADWRDQVNNTRITLKVINERNQCLDVLKKLLDYDDLPHWARHEYGNERGKLGYIIDEAADLVYSITRYAKTKESTEPSKG